MTMDRTDLSRSPPGTDRLTTAEVVDRLGRFDGPPEQFLSHLLAVQCQMGAAASGAILRRSADQRSAEILAVHPAFPPGAAVPVWVAQAAEAFQEVLAAASTVVRPIHGAHDLYGQPAQRHLVLVPLLRGQAKAGLAAFVVETADPAVLAAARERLELTVGLLSLYELRVLLARRQADLKRLRSAMETQAAVHENDRFTGLAMALCNELAARWQCDRVSLGFLRGRYVKVRAMSHTEKFSRKMKIVQDLEAAMEECLDQDLEIVFPTAVEATYVSRAAGELARRHGPSAVLSLPVRRGGEVKAVLTLERPADRPFALEDIETLRLAADLITPRLVNLEESDRWFGARAVAGLRKGLAALVGPKHTWVKVAVVLAVGFLLFAFLGEGTYRVESPFVFEPVEQQVIPAPFDGYLDKVFVEPPDEVEAGKTVLATLDTVELKLRLAAARKEQILYQKQAAAATASREDKTVDAQIAQAQADRIAAQMDDIQYQIDHATIVSPITGRVVAGYQKRQQGGPVKTGDVLFEIAPLEALRAELAVPQDQIGDVIVGQEGELATNAYPDQHIRFVVERITPMAEVVERENVFKVRVRLASTEPWMRPGMEGLAKVDVGPRRHAWIWARPAINWVRMKLWL
jgi:multidrug resistance efflux pump